MNQNAVPTGLDLIAAERRRQVEEELRAPEGDDLHVTAELARAGGCYALQAGCPDFVRDHNRAEGTVPAPWPWHESWWKPGSDNSNASRIRELVKAGALIAAEIDRLQRREANGAA